MMMYYLKMEGKIVGCAVSLRDARRHAIEFAYDQDDDVAIDIVYGEDEEYIETIEY